MNKKILLMVLMLCIVSFLGVGYAALTSSLSISGDVYVEKVDYDEIVITNVTTMSSSLTKEEHRAIAPTNVQTFLTGNAGQTVVYKITAHNYSKTETYVYCGMKYSADFNAVANKLSITASMQQNGAEPLPNAPNANCAEGTLVAPGEEFVFYAAYTVNSSLSSGELLLNYVFKPVIYSITYLNDNAVYAVDHVTDNSVPYTVRKTGPNKGSQLFSGWVNANAAHVESYPAGNTHDYTLSAKWDNVYLIMFVDEEGNILYQETFTDSTKKNGLSAAGQTVVNAKLAELAEKVAADEMTVAWSSYDMKNATSDITVRPVYTYTGNLRFTPIDTNNDGVIDYYQVDAVNKLSNPTKIPGRFQGLAVEVVNKLYLNENNFDYGAGVTTIEIGEGIKRINHNSLAYTSALKTVKMPSTLEYMGKNTFSRNFGNDKKVLTIEFNGTMAEWQTIVNNSDKDWHNGLKTGSVVKCKDGYYELDRGFLELGGYDWDAHYY